VRQFFGAALRVIFDLRDLGKIRRAKRHVVVGNQSMERVAADGFTAVAG